MTANLQLSKATPRHVYLLAYDLSLSLSVPFADSTVAPLCQQKQTYRQPQPAMQKGVTDSTPAPTHAQTIHRVSVRHLYPNPSPFSEASELVFARGAMGIS